MKSHLSLFVISGIIIFSVIIGIFIWRNQDLKEIPKFTEKSFTAPITSKYIPEHADLVLHWKINPTKIPSYIENYQDKINKNITNKKIKLIRDAFFKLISLDFTKDIANWSGENGSFAIFETNNQLLNDWLIVLEINKDLNIDEKLELFSRPNITDENTNSSNELNISKSKLITKNINSSQSIYFLNEKEYILISTNPALIKSSINQSSTNTLNTKEKYKDIKLRNSINDGIILLEMSPKRIFNLIGQEEDLLAINKSKELILSINIDKKKILFEGTMSYDIKNKRPINDLTSDLSNMEKEFDLFNTYIVINNPKKYFRENSSHPYEEFIASIMKGSTSEDYSNLIRIILENTKGNLIWLKDKNWLAITRKSDTYKKEISDILKRDNFLNSTLEFNNKNLEIWSKITTNNNEGYEIKEKIEAIIEDNEDIYIWGQDLPSIANFDNNKYSLNNIDTENAETENNDFEEVIKIHLGEKETELFLNDFYPHILLQSIVGNKLGFPNEIDISVAIPTVNYPDFVKFQINLKTS